MINKSNKFSKIDKRFNALKNDASVWRATWEELRDWIYPTRGKFEGDLENDGNLFNYQNIINNAPQIYVNNFASGMSSGMTSQARKWFKIDIENINEYQYSQEIKKWLENAENKIYAVFASSNIYQSLFALYEEISIFGTACCLIEEDFVDIVRLRTFTAGEYFLACDNKGRVNTFCREFSLTTSQMVEEFGYDNCGANVRNAFDRNDMDIKFKVRHMICPNLNRDLAVKNNRNMEYSSYYWELGNNEQSFLRESGYNTFPILAPRWALTTTTDTYGKDSPGWKSLGDNKQLQLMEKNKLYNIDLLNDPPKIMDSDIDDYDFRPGGLSRYNSNNPNAMGVKNIDVNPVGIQELEYSIQRVEMRIAKAFFADLFMMITGMQEQQRTATEIRARIEEKMLMLAPALMRLNDEALSPLIEYTFNKLLESGMLGEVPEELMGMDYKIEYISTIAQAQKMTGTQSMEQLVASAGNLSAVKPDVLDNIDFDEWINEYAEKLGVSAKIIKGKEVVADMRRQRNIAQAQMQQAEMAMQTAQGAKVLSETKIKPNTALTELLGGANA